MEETEKMTKSDTQNIEEYLKFGEYVYELFSILIHSGGANAGHYYAYIKSFEDQKWYNFNDSSVREIPLNEVQSEIQSMYGGGNTSSYMLQYRKHDPSQISLIIEPDVIPEYLKEEVQIETDKMIADQKKKLDNLLKIQVKVYGTDGS